jgi:hypothetical protein
MLCCFSLFLRQGPIHGRGIVAFPHNAAKRAYQLRSGRAQFVVMMKRQFAENLLAFGSECEQDLAAIVMSARAMDKSSGL